MLLWKSGTVENMQPGDPKNYAASDWFGVDDVRPGDVVWAVTSLRSDHLRLVARIVADRVLHSRAEAVAILGERVWQDSEHFVIGHNGDDDSHRDIDLTAIAHALTFAGGVDHLPAGFDGRNLQRMRRLTSTSSALLQRAWEDEEAANQESVLEDDADGFPEGGKAWRKHRTSERSAELVRKKKALGRNAAGRLVCEVCQFDFEDRYGAVGTGYIECHHTIPVSEMSENAQTRLEDVVLVCSNCHRMLHRRRPWLSMQEIHSVLRDQTRHG